MSKRLRWLVLLTAASLVAVGLLGLGGLVSRSRARVQRLPDGTLLSLEAVTYGQEHHIVRGTWWQTLLNPLLTNEARNRLGMMFPQYQSASANTLVLWTLRDVPGRARPGILPS